MFRTLRKSQFSISSEKKQNRNKLFILLSFWIKLRLKYYSCVFQFYESMEFSFAKVGCIDLLSFAQERAIIDTTQFRVILSDKTLFQSDGQQV